MLIRSTKPLIAFFFFLASVSAFAVTQTASLRVNSATKYQKITGFGGFVCSPQFGYNHMTTAEIRKMWGKASEAGLNIMRLYIPTGETAWSASLETAKLAKSLGLTVFASPWSMPAAWKTNNNIAATYTDGNGVQQLGYLKEEYYDDYALYLNNYVSYLKTNGVSLDAISIQNEPDMKATYAGCLWTPEQMANFVKRNAAAINCKVMAPESVGITDNYVNASLEDSVTAELDIFAGHQYGYIQDGLKKMQAKGKEVWMTEYLINWNADENTTRNFSWAKDGFSFATEVNRAMLSNINAWIHYATKRYYGLMGDGTMGTTTGVMTKRGYILSHFAKNTIGSTRIESTWKDDTQKLQGSSYLTVTGDSVVVMVINPTADSYNLTLDLPFYTVAGKSVTTSETVNMATTPLSYAAETFRPNVTLAPSTFTTLVFAKSSVRPVSLMTGSAVHSNKIESMTVSNAAFGSAYKLSGKTVTFDHSNSLISINTTSANGFLRLDDRYAKLVFRIASVSSTMNYTSANTTLYYVNGSGAVNSYNYGTVNFDKNGNYDWALDISKSVLTDRCTGLIGISNSNYSSILSLQFGDVFLQLGNEKQFRFAGAYSKDDSNLFDCLEDSAYVSLDFSATSGVDASADWRSAALNKNALFYVGSGIANSQTNVVSGTTCANLQLSGNGGNFYAPAAFTATNAGYACSLNGKRMLLLPFACTLPAGVSAYTLKLVGTVVECTPVTGSAVAANTPMLVDGVGNVTFLGSGQVSTPKALTVNGWCGVYQAAKAPANAFVLKSAGGTTLLHKVSVGAEPLVSPFSAYLAELAATSVTLQFNEVAVKPLVSEKSEEGDFYDLSGRRVAHPTKGFYLRKGKKYLFY
jgi:glucuronoarabinoxylan endo-1,4-beta-xylanase